MPAQFTLGYYPWITQGVEAAAIRPAIESFARAVEIELRKTELAAAILVTDPVVCRRRSSASSMAQIPSS